MSRYPDLLCHLKPEPVQTDVPHGHPNHVHKPPQLAQSSHHGGAAARYRGPRGSLPPSFSQSDARHPAGSSRSLPKTHNNNNSWGSKQNLTYKLRASLCSTYSITGVAFYLLYLLLHLIRCWCSQRYTATILFDKLVSQCNSNTCAGPALPAHHLSATGGGKGFKLFMQFSKS